MSVDPSAVTAASPGAGSGEPEARVDASVGKYRLDHLLGAGGMGLVWAAFDPDLERAVAVKLLRQEAAAPEMRTRLLREARAMAKLRHPNVVGVFDVGTDKGRDFIAMELVDGGTLDDWLKTQPSREAIIDALVAAGRGLAAAHGAGLVHRDFKPHNVLRGKDGSIFVTDFGLARGQIEEGPELVRLAVPVEPGVTRSRDFLDSTLTQTGVLIGTPAYMAPEQFAGGAPDPKSDQFAFCVTAWQALTGERPFRGSSVVELEAAAKGGVAKLAADLPAPLRATLERGLDPDPAKRWPDMATLLDALGAAREPARRRRWLVPMLAGTALAAGGITVALVASGDDNEELCEPAETAFARAWTPDMRVKFRQRGPEAIGGLYVIEELKRRWTRAYTAACEAPKSNTQLERVRCLLNVRDQIGATLASPNVELADVATHLGGLAICDPDSAADWDLPRIGPRP